MKINRKKAISYTFIFAIIAYVFNYLWPFIIGLIMGHETFMAGLHGCIPKSDLNLDGKNFTDIFVRSEEFHYIKFDKASFHPYGSTPILYNNVYYRVDNKAIIDSFNAKMNSSMIVDIEKVAVGICSDQMYNTGFFDVLKKKYFTIGALYYDSVQIYPDTIICNCRLGCK